MTQVATIPIDQIDPVPERKPRKRTNGKELAVATEAPVPVAISEDAAFIALFERMARDPTIDPARVHQFIQMKRDEEDRRARRSFLAAFAKMQSELPAVERKGKGQNDKKYARFEDFIQTIKPHLSANGFSLSFRLASEANILRVTGVLGHVDGHQEATDLPLPADTGGNKNNVQAWGSTISYGKRYVGMTLLGIATEGDDDDGKAAGAGTTITDAQCSAILDKIAETESDIAKFCAYFRVDGVAKLPAKDYQRAIDALAAKRRK